MEHCPPELLERIFMYLRQKDIERAARVCKRWHAVICDSQCIGKNMTLFINLNPSLKRKSSLKSFYGKLRVDDVNLDNIEIMEEKLKAAKIRNLKAVSISFSFVTALKITTHFHGMTHLKLHGIQGKPNLRIEPIEMPSLTHLNIDSSCWMLPLIVNHRIQHLIFDESMDWNSNEDPREKFLSTCVDLKHLKIVGDYPEFIMSNYTFKLEKLEISGDDLGIFIDFLGLLDSQKESLKELALNVMDMDAEISNFVYFEMNLEKLLDNRLYHYEVEEEINSSIKSLSVCMDSQQNDHLCSCEPLMFIEKVLNNCKALEWLNVKIMPTREEQTFRLLDTVVPRLKVVVLSFCWFSQLLKIENWLKTRNYELSLVMSDVNCGDHEKSNSIILQPDSTMLLLTPVENMSASHRIGKIKQINETLEVLRENNVFTLRRPSGHQAENSVQFYFHNFVYYPYCAESSEINYLHFDELLYD